MRYIVAVISKFEYSFILKPSTSPTPMAGKDTFLKIYANLPINLRDEIVLVLSEKGPITWNVAFLEVENETPLGREILKKLTELNIM